MKSESPPMPKFIPMEGRSSSTWLDQVLSIWNDRSGTTEVLHLKQQVSTKSQAFDEATIRVTNARRKLDDCTLQWERASGMHLQLLQRRESWTEEDAQQFATLVGKEVKHRTEMEQARTELASAESHLSSCQLDYMNAMRKRYHEEQIWQDQWRVLGTYGTWSLIVLNSFIFLASQAFHYRRENQKMKHMEDLVKSTLNTISSTIPNNTDSVPADLSQASAIDAEISSHDSMNTAQQPTSSNATHQESGENSIASPDNGERDKETPLVLSSQVQIEQSPSVKCQDNQVDNLPDTMGWRDKSKFLVTTAVATTRKFFEDLHVPSAAFGASVSGVVVFTAVTLLMPRRPGST